MSRSVSPVASRRSLSRFRIWACTETSRDEVGSSQTISLRTGAERARDGEPLPLAARKCVREPLGRIGFETDGFDERRDVAQPRPRGREAIEQDRLGQDRADAHAAVERRIGILENHLDRLTQRPDASAPRPRRQSALPAIERRARPWVSRGPRRRWRSWSCRSRIRPRGRRPRRCGRRS